MTAVLEAAREVPLDEARRRYRTFVTETVTPWAEDYDLAGALPDSLLRETAAAGFLGAVLDRDGSAASGAMARFGVLHEEIGRGCSSLRSVLTVHSMVAHALGRWGDDTARDRWLGALGAGELIGSFCLSEPEAGSDIGALHSTATPCPGGYVLNGHKKWVTAGQIAGLLLVFARTERGVSAFLVEATAPGIERRPVERILGTRASMLAEIRFTDCRVDRTALVGAEGMGIAVATDALDIGRFSVACGCVGIGQACVEASLAHAAGRVQGGSRLGGHQLVQRILTDMVTDVRAARLLCMEAGRSKDEGDPATITATCVAKYFAARAAMKAAADTVQLHGAEGCQDGHPAARLFRDAKIMEIIEGSTQIQQLLIGQAALQGQGDPLLRAVENGAVR